MATSSGVASDVHSVAPPPEGAQKAAHDLALSRSKASRKRHQQDAIRGQQQDELERAAARRAQAGSPSARTHKMLETEDDYDLTSVLRAVPASPDIKTEGDHMSAAGVYGRDER